MPPYWDSHRAQVDSAISSWRHTPLEVHAPSQELLAFSELADDLLGRVPSSSHQWVLSCLRHHDGDARTAQLLDHYEGLTPVRVGVIDLIGLAAEHHQGELDSERLRLERLDSEEQKLLAAHYADAVSLSLLQKEQRRIAGDRANSEGIIAALSMESRAMEKPLEQALSRIELSDEVYQGRILLSGESRYHADSNLNGKKEGLDLDRDNGASGAIY